MNINIYDVSKKAGVSIATVSRVLNGNTRVSEKTRDKVINAMKSINDRVIMVVNHLKRIWSCMKKEIHILYMNIK